VTVPGFVAAIQAKDEAALRAALAPTFTATANGKSIDAEGQVALIRSWWTGFPEAKFDFEVVGGHGRYVLTWKIHGPHGGDYLGIPATGRPVEISGFTTARSDAAGVQEMSWKWDTKTFARSVLGPEPEYTPPPPPPKRHLVAPWEQGQRGGPRHKGKGKPRPQGTAGAEAPTEGGMPPGGQPTAGATDGQRRGRRRRGKGPRGPKPEGQPAGPGNVPDGASKEFAETPAAPGTENAGNAAPSSEPAEKAPDTNPTQ
jgi:hypothetical protein